LFVSLADRRATATEMPERGKPSVESSFAGMTKMVKSSITMTTVARRVLPLVALACSAITSQGKADGTQLSPDALFYDRLVRLEYPINAANHGMIIAAGTAAAPTGGLQAGIFQGGADGTSFSPLATIADPDFAAGLCCGTLYELPQQIGGLRRGTLLWAGSVGQNTINITGV
jgi:hypothetical protein